MRILFGYLRQVVYLRQYLHQEVYLHQYCNLRLVEFHEDYPILFALFRDDYPLPPYRELFKVDQNV